MHNALRAMAIPGLLALSTVAVHAQSPQDTLSDYALAACLTERATGALRDEGYSLASIALFRMNRSPLDVERVRKAIAIEIARTPMTTVHIDAPVDRSDKAAPLAYCLGISRSASVRVALARLDGGRARRR